MPHFMTIRQLYNADTSVMRQTLGSESVLRRVNFPFMINTPLKEGQGKNTPIRRLDIPDLIPSLTPPDGRGGGRIQSDRPFCNANTDF